MEEKLIVGERKKYPLAEARRIASEVVEELRPFCKRIELAGSIRRKKPMVGDAEILLIPEEYSTGLLENGLASIVNRWPKVKGELEYGKTKYTKREHPSGIKLDIFFAEEGNWGAQLAIRTGPAEYSHKVLARGWVRNGFKSEGGYLWKDGKRYEAPEEEDLFRLAGVKYVPPEDRNL